MHRCYALTALAVVIGTLLVLPASASAQPLAHMVFFELADNTAANRDTLVKACHKHLSKHDGTLYFSAGVRVQELKRGVNDTGFDVALHMVFKNKAAHDKYQTHPRHLKFIEENKHLWKSVRVFDSYLAQPKRGKRGAARDGLRELGSAREIAVAISAKR